jgi:hypothetical protein
MPMSKTTMGYRTMRESYRIFPGRFLKAAVLEDIMPGYGRFAKGIVYDTLISSCFVPVAPFHHAS